MMYSSKTLGFLMLLTISVSWLMTSSTAFVAQQSFSFVGPMHASPLHQLGYSLSRIRPGASSSSRLSVVADAEQEEKKGRRENDDDGSVDDWIPTSSGGFLPNLTKLLSRKPAGSTDKLLLTEVTTLQDYKDQVVDNQEGIVCVRFYAPWCRACKAVQSHYRQLATAHPNVKFVQVPLTKENAFLHTGLGIPSMPYAHIYHPTAGLVDERSINKKIFGQFKRSLQTYADEECAVEWDADGNLMAPAQEPPFLQ